jgi:hypothetical protein
VVETAKNWFKENSTLVSFLAAQALALAIGGASVLSYFTVLETRVSIMETRGAEYTVARMEEMKLRIAKLEQSIEKNERSIDRIVEVMTKKLNINP